jgi:hypothetical protein
MVWLYNGCIELVDKLGDEWGFSGKSLFIFSVLSADLRRTVSGVK